MADGGRILIAVTGASGSAYALRLGQALIAAGVGADFIFSKAALLVLATETELTLPAKLPFKNNWTKACPTHIAPSKLMLMMQIVWATSQYI